MSNNNLQEKEFIEINFIKNKYPKTYRLFTILPGFISISIILTIVVGYGFFLFDKNFQYSSVVLIVALIILFYYIWWLIRGFEYIMLIFVGIFNMFKYERIDFYKILFGKGPYTKNESYFRIKMKKDITPQEVIHWFIVPTYKEDIGILRETINNLKSANYDIKKFAVTIAGEEGDKENFLKIVEVLKEEFNGIFGHMGFTVHPKGIPGEIPGKGGNINHAASREYEEIIKVFNVTPDRVLVTTLDADTNIGKNYTNVLTYTYIQADDRKYKSYQPIILFFNNFWETPFFGKVISFGNSFFMMFNAVKKYGMRNFSTHAQSLDALIEVNFWSSQTIVEDGHQYWRSYFIFNGRYECVPLYTKVFQDANVNKSFYLTAKAQYNQMRRWGHGIEDIPYVFCEWIYNFKKISFARTFYEFVRLFEGLIMWGTLHIILTAGLTFTLIKDFSISTFISLGGTISLFINMSITVLIFITTLYIIFSPWEKLPGKRNKIREFIKFIIVQLWLAGPSLLLFNGLPALHTQIALMLGKPMKKFNVTEKIRKQ